MFSRLKERLGRKFVVSLLALAAMGVALWYFFPKGSSGLAHRFVPGQRLVFDVEYLTISTSNFMGLTDEDIAGVMNRQSQATRIHTNVAAEVVATVVEVTKDGAVVAMALRKPSITIVSEGELALDMGRVVETELALPFFVQLDARGRIVNVRFAQDVQSITQSFAKSLLGSIQVVLPTDVAEETWQTREEDPNGTFLASYTRKSPLAGAVIELEKRRMSYVPKVAKKKLRTFEADTIVNPTGQIAVEFDAIDGAVKSLIADETTTVVADGQVVARSESKLKLRLIGREKLETPEQKSLRANLKAAATAQLLSTPGDRSKADAAMYKQELGDDTLDSLMKTLAKIQADSESGADDTKLYLKFKALLHLRPDAALHIGKELAVLKTKGPAFPMLCGALSSVGNDHAQSALQAAIAARPDDWEALMELIPAISMVEAPTQATEQTLRDLVQKALDPQIRSTAHLSLGIVARALADTDPARSNRILLETLKNIGGAAAPDARRQNLLVLGNIGANEALPVITKHLTDEDAPVRAAAAIALRWLESDDIDGLLVKALTNDTNEGVRQEVVNALGYRPMTAFTFAAHKTALAKDASAHVRKSLLRNVAQAHRGFSEARVILADVAQNDSSEDVREVGARLLLELGQ
ncbi:MAG: hypothetical protein EXR98_18020 [Gemmataceae bacterium]|nr:hypothetical protein [Gemmataceae bacterium]